MKNLYLFICLIFFYNFSHSNDIKDNLNVEISGCQLSGGTIVGNGAISLCENDSPEVLSVMNEVTDASAGFPDVVWGAWVLSDPLNETSVPSGLVPNDSYPFDDENYAGILIQSGQNTYGTSVNLQSDGTGITYYIAPMIGNGATGAIDTQCTGLNPSEGYTVYMKSEIKPRIRVNSCAISVELKGGHPQVNPNFDYSWSYLTPSGQTVTGTGALIDVIGGAGNYRFSVTDDGSGCELLNFATLSLPNTCTGYSTCTTDKSKVIVNVTIDKFGTETYWKLSDNNTGVTYGLVNPGTYPSGDEHIGTKFTDTLCVPPDACLNFTINDSFDNGICCEEGNGSYEVIFEGAVVASGGEFEDIESTSFNCPPGLVCNQAVPISEGNYTTETANQFYEFTPSQAGMYKITTCDLNSCNTKIWIYDNCNNTNYESNIGTIFYNDNNTECNAAASIQAALNPAVTYYIRIGDAAGDCEGTMINWSLSYEGPVVGCTDMAACNYNPLATESDDSCLYGGDVGCPGPDLVLLEDKLRNTLQMGTVDNTDNCFVSEGCLNGYGTRDVVRFTTHIRNIGEVDYYIGKPSANPDQFTYDNCHNHNHYDGYAEYILYDDEGTEIPIGQKTGFCVIDLECPIMTYNCQDMGITAGCGDIYDAQLDCQWIDVTDTEDGTYTLVARVNWDNAPDALGRYETDFENNWAQACIRIYTEPSGTRAVERLADCERFIDCAGEIYGSAQPDCEGTCNGTALMGDLNANSSQDVADSQNYVAKILDNTITPTPCNDLNGDNAITVYDAALLASCIKYGETHPHPETGFHDHCRFPSGILNTNQTVGLSINDINYSEKYIDIDITNPGSLITAYQFNMSGIDIAYVENLVDPTIYPITPQATVGGQTVIGISYDMAYIEKSFGDPLCRIYYSEITDDQICIESITEIINSDDEQTLSEIGGDCLMVVGIENPLTTIEASITPNPATDVAILTFPNPSNEVFTLKMTDVTGRIIRTHEEIRGTTFIIQREELESGVYFYHLESDRKTATGKLVLQ